MRLPLPVTNRAPYPVLKVAHRCHAVSAVMANAKSFFPEDHPNFIGTYWGQARRSARSRFTIVSVSLSHGGACTVRQQSLPADQCQDRVTVTQAVTRAHDG